MNNKRVLGLDSEEYSKLEDAVGYLLHRTYGMSYKINTIWEDYGAGLEWTTIIANNLISGSEWQILSPRAWESLTSAETYGAVKDIVEEIIYEYPSLYNICQCKDCRFSKRGSDLSGGHDMENIYCKHPESVAYDHIVKPNFFCNYFLKKK